MIKFVHVDHVRDWFSEGDSLTQFIRSIGESEMDPEYVESAFGLPLHLRFVVGRLARELGEAPANALDSIAFYSLCKGLFLPLSGLSSDRAARLFGLRPEEPPSGGLHEEVRRSAGATQDVMVAEHRSELVASFIAKEIGLSFGQKIACLLGDPFFGGSGGLRRDSLLRILHREGFATRKEILDRLAAVGDVAVLWASNRPALRIEPALTAAEVLETLRLVSSRSPMSARLSRVGSAPSISPAKVGRNEQAAVLQSLFQRCGKLEAYFLVKLILRKAGFGFEYDGQAICELIARQFGVEESAVVHAVALTDTFFVISLLSAKGADGLREITLQPLVPVRPALAGGASDDIEKYPVWIERKYDGIRLTLHKATDIAGGVLCGAYTRNRLDWIELVSGLDATVRMLPAKNVIIDGELYGTVFTLDGIRPANVYEVYAALHGQPSVPVTLRFAAFDILYYDGRDLTALPLYDRRKFLTAVVGPLAQFGATPVSISLADGAMAASKDDVNRLFLHFRAQGYEGIIAKDASGAYRLGQRDPTWLKRKPEITLDLVLMGATLAVTSKENAGRFGSYVIGARSTDGSFVEVGDVAGVDRERDLAIQHTVMRDGLLTGRRIERASASGERPGYALRPSVVVTVRFEGVIRESAGALSLRDPKLVAIRSDKNPSEADLVSALEEIYLRQRVG